MGKKKDGELSVEEAKAIVRQFPDQNGEDEAGVILDQEEAVEFSGWWCGPEVKEIRERLKAQQED